MVDVLGHLGMALVWLAPVWFVADRPKTAATFVGAGVWFGMLPDVDLVLSRWFPQAIHHHGVFHTVLVVAILAALLGPVVGLVLQRALGGTEWFAPRTRGDAAALGVVAVLVPGLSHLFADMLSAPDVAQPIEPLWPLYGSRVVRVDVLYFSSFRATWGLLILGLAVNGGLWAWRVRRG